MFRDIIFILLPSAILVSVSLLLSSVEPRLLLGPGLLSTPSARSLLSWATTEPVWFFPILASLILLILSFIGVCLGAGRSLVQTPGWDSSWSALLAESFQAPKRQQRESPGRGGNSSWSALLAESFQAPTRQQRGSPSYLPINFWLPKLGLWNFWCSFYGNILWKYLVEYRLSHFNPRLPTAAHGAALPKFCFYTMKGSWKIFLWMKHLWVSITIRASLRLYLEFYRNQNSGGKGLIRNRVWQKYIDGYKYVI